MRKLALVLFGVIALVGCTTAQMDKASSYQATLSGACDLALSVATGTTLSWVKAACGSEVAIAKLALDPTSLEWLRGLVAKAKVSS